MPLKHWAMPLALVKPLSPSGTPLPTPRQRYPTQSPARRAAATGQGTSCLCPVAGREPAVPTDGPLHDNAGALGNALRAGETSSGSGTPLPTARQRYPTQSPARRAAHDGAGNVVF